MATPQVLNQWRGKFLPGSVNDAQLFHADASDRILVVPPHLGQGYIQEISLQDDLLLLILDYTLSKDVIIDTPDQHDRIEFEFVLTGSAAGHSIFFPHFGLRQFGVKRSRQRCFKVEVIFKQSTVIPYFRAYLERLSPQAQSIAEQLIQVMYRHHNSSVSSLVKILNQVIQNGIAVESGTALRLMFPDKLDAEAIIFNYENSIPITPTMYQVIGQILSCPYRGKTRRTYLERQALELMSLRLAAMEQPRLSEADLSSVNYAASILRNQLSNPPLIESLAQQACTNRLKLNQGFREVYGTTPYGYLRDCRLWQAQRLLMISDLAIAEIAASVGYTSRSHFALAFRQATGLNPKKFQLQAWQWAS